MLKFILLALTIFRILSVSSNRKLIISKFRNLIVHSTFGLEPKAPATRSTANEPISSHGALDVIKRLECTVRFVFCSWILINYDDVNNFRDDVSRKNKIRLEKETLWYLNFSLSNFKKLR